MRNSRNRASSSICPAEPGIQGVDPRYCGGELADDQLLGIAAQEAPGRFQARDHHLQLLAVGGPDEAVSGVGQHHPQGPHRAAVSRLRVVDETQTAEVQLGHFPEHNLPIRIVLRLLPGSCGER